MAAAETATQRVVMCSGQVGVYCGIVLVLAAKLVILECSSLQGFALCGQPLTG
jgi:hypothetical protein